MSAEAPSVPHLPPPQKGVTNEDLNNWFVYHKPKPDQVERYEYLRREFKHLAFVIIDNTVSCADQTAAFRLLRECAMAVNQTVACNE